MQRGIIDLRSPVRLRPEVSLPWLSLVTLITSTDSAVLADSTATVRPLETDAATAADATATVILPSSDPASLSESQIAALPDNDSAIVSEATTVRIADTDAAVLADATAKVVLPSSDPSSLTEAQAQALPDNDAASASEASTTRLPSTDAATVSESASLAREVLSDTDSASTTETEKQRLPQTDAAVLAEVETIIVSHIFSDTDGAVVTDTAILHAKFPDSDAVTCTDADRFRWKSTDSAHLTESVPVIHLLNSGAIRVTTAPDTIAMTDSAVLRFGNVSTRLMTWFAPDFNVADTTALFTNPSAWPLSRAEVNVFKVYEVGLIAPGFNGTTFAKLQAVNWLPKLASWHIDLACEVGVIKGYDCTGALLITQAEQAVTVVEGGGGQIKYLALDEPLYASRTACPQSMASAANVVTAFVTSLKAFRSYLHFVLIEPYPATISAADMQTWLTTLAGLGFIPDSFHIDVNFSYLYANAPALAALAADMAAIKSTCTSLGIRFGVIYKPNGDNGGQVTGDQQYATQTLANLALMQATKVQPNDAVFQSFMVNSTTGLADVPTNLPETKPYTHTWIILNGVATIGEFTDLASMSESEAVFVAVTKTSTDSLHATEVESFPTKPATAPGFTDAFPAPSMTDQFPELAIVGSDDSKVPLD